MQIGRAAGRRWAPAQTHTFSLGASAIGRRRGAKPPAVLITMMMRVAARIAALWCAAAVALQRPAQRARPQRSARRAAHVCAPGDYVKVDWSIACTSGKPIPADELMFDQGEVQFQVGAGNYLPALHGQLLSSELAVGETATFDVSAADAFGAKDPRLGPLAVPAAQAPRGMKAGDLAGLENGMMARVVSADDLEVVIDANHVLAGEDLAMSVTLLAPPCATTLEEATFAGGCFWGVELAFQREPGVAATAVGYAMGDVPNPTYEAVCSGATGHTEAVRVMYDPALVSFERLCDLFWDRLGENRYAPNQVGNDRGTQYRHGIYYRDAAQRDVALKTFDVESARFPERKIVTEVLPLTIFYDAEDYHMQYLQKKGQSAKKNDEATIRCYG